MMNDFDTDSKWFGLFHNSMGLGMEILGHILNMVIDGCLFAVFLTALFVTLKINKLNDDAPVGRPDAYPACLWILVVYRSRPTSHCQ